MSRPKPPARRGVGDALLALVHAVSLPIRLVLLAAPTALAHPLAPALLELREETSGRVAVMWKRSALRVPGKMATIFCPMMPTLSMLNWAS